MCLSELDVWRGRGDENLCGPRRDGHAQGLRRTAWDRARPVGLRSDERASVPVHECKANPAEGDGLGWKRFMGLRETP